MTAPSREERLAEALREIVALDPGTDSAYGYNEWGQANCFDKAQSIASSALSPVEIAPANPGGEPSEGAVEAAQRVASGRYTLPSRIIVAILLAAYRVDFPKPEDGK